MLVNGTLKRAGIESFPTVSLPPAASFPFRMVFDETLAVLLISNGTSWQTFNSQGAITFPTTAPTSPSGLEVSTSGIATYSKLFSKRDFMMNGPTVVRNSVDGYLFFDHAAIILSVFVSNRVAGSSGITEVDLKVATTPGAAFSSILSTSCFITSAAASEVWTDSGSVIAPQTGVTKPVLSVTSIPAGSVIRMDVAQAMLGGRDVTASVFYKEIP